jgi:hypothetical protein
MSLVSRVSNSLVISASDRRAWQRTPVLRARARVAAGPPWRRTDAHIQTTTLPALRDAESFAACASARGGRRR